MKPVVFSYKRYEELREAYKQVLQDNQKLTSDNRRLRDKVANLEIRCRIAEEDHPRIAFKCDGRACNNECEASECTHTKDVNHAANFKKISDGCFMETDAEKRGTE